MSRHQIQVFISHAWAHSHHYDRLASWIFHENWSFGQAGIDFRNFSVPKDDPIHNAPNVAALEQAILAKIARSHVIVVPTGMYAAYSKWIERELRGANSYSKPILAVNPWGQKRAADIVRSNAHREVGWNKKPIVDAIWQLYRG